MFFIGIDASKAKLDCSLLMDATSNKRKTKVVINSKTGISDLLVWTNSWSQMINCTLFWKELVCIMNKPPKLSTMQVFVFLS
jgi:hypothetical protein